MKKYLLLIIVLILSINVSVAQSLAWRFVAMGDTRGTSNLDPINTTVLPEIAVEIVRQHAEFVIVVGDLAYVGSQPFFSNWKNIMAPVYNAGIPVLPVLGNHDANDLTSYLNLFSADIPTNGPAGEKYRTFAFRNKNVLMIGMDNYVTPARVNQSWLNNVLAQNTLPHVFVYAHQPAFKVNHADCMDDYPSNRDVFWQSLIDNNCKIYFSGHDHMYDRLRAGGIYQMIVGMGGAPLHTGTYPYNGSNSNWNPVKQYHEAQFGYSLITIDDLTVTIEFWRRQSSAVGAVYSPTDIWSYTIPATRPATPKGLKTDGIY